MPRLQILYISGLNTHACNGFFSWSATAYGGLGSLESPKSGFYVEPARSLGRLNRWGFPWDGMRDD